MKKTFIKRITILGLIGALLIPTAAFANDTTTTTSNMSSDQTASKHPVKEGLRERIEDGKGPLEKEDKRGGERNGERRDQFNDRTLELVTLYTPELLESFETAIASQVEVQNALEALHKSTFDANSVEFKALLETLKNDITAGTITREEAKVKIEAFRTSGQSDRDALKTELDALRETYALDQEANRTLMTTLKTAVDNNDEATIKTSLSTLLSNIQKHTEYEKAVYNLLSSK